MVTTGVSGVLWLFGVTVGTTAAAALLCLTAYILWIHNKYAHVPGPQRGSFYLGNLPELSVRFAKGGSFVMAMLDWSIEFGYTYVIFILQKPLVITIDPKGVKELLVTGSFPKSKWQYESIQSLYGTRFLGEGLVSDYNHDNWSVRRTLMNPAFSRKLLKPMMGEFNVTADRLMDNLSSVADGRTVISLLDKLHRTTLDVIGKVAYGMDIDSIHDDNNPFPRAIAKSLEGFRESSRNPFERMLPFLRRSFKKEVRDACNLLRKVALEKVEERKEAIRRGDEVPLDILSYIIKTHNETGSSDFDGIGDDFITFFVAGQETTANALGFALMELGRHPEVFAKLRSEVDETLGDRSYIEYSDLAALRYCDSILKETLRLYPPAGVTFREVNREGFELTGLHMPKGTDVAISTFASSRSPDLVKDPLRFYPERFEDDELRPSAYVTFPFVLGPRNCIGQNFARMEAKVLLAKFVQRFDFTLDPNQSFDIQETTTLRPKGMTMAILKFRD